MRSVSCSASGPCVPVGVERWKNNPAQPREPNTIISAMEMVFFLISWSDKCVNLLLEKGLDVNGAQLIRFRVWTRGIAAR